MAARIAPRPRDSMTPPGGPGTRCLVHGPSIPQRPRHSNLLRRHFASPVTDQIPSAPNSDSRMTPCYLPHVLLNSPMSFPTSPRLSELPHDLPVFPVSILSLPRLFELLHVLPTFSMPFWTSPRSPNLPQALATFAAPAPPPTPRRAVHHLPHRTPTSLMTFHTSFAFLALTWLGDGWISSTCEDGKEGSRDEEV